MASNRICKRLTLAVPQRLRHVFSDQPRFAVDLNGSDRAELWVLENL